MGIRSRIKKVILPIIGSGSRSEPIRDVSPRPAPANRWTEPEEEEEEQSPRGDRPVQEWLPEVVAAHGVVLFMKGSPSAPQCGFSANAAGILSSYGKPFHHVNVLADPDIRQGIKEFSDWPTIPQVYIGGEFVGGSDILTEMHNNGELKELLDGLGEG
ncbi:MAG: Grx4 family monothiol glutaredoxin [Alphaproteobacteria bacterium]|nr:Grx4 family monothiol glutaredoxin [Alphaproteobacteria bacterium]